MNPYGVSGNIFESNSDQSANSFKDPMNMAHLYPGWGANPNYQTPAYDAPYRPAYQGPNPYAAYQKPGFMGGISQLYNPFYKDPYWGNPVDNNRQAFNSIGNRPMDAAAEIGQRFISPAVIYGVSQATLGGFGTRVGAGIAEGLGASVGGRIAGAAGMFGSFAIPIAIGSGVVHAVEKGVFQPYIRSRQMAEMVQDNFAGITFAGGGNSISGRGFSSRQSINLGSSIDNLGMRDMTFGANQMGGIASMGMRAGLFDQANSTGDILKQVGSIAAQIKTIVAISKDPNIQSAIEELAKLRLGGASITGGANSVAMGAYGMIGMHASAAGASVQRVMNTVGNQGQYMFQMNGLTPYLGQLSAASAFSGFAAAQRTGLISTAQMARMGGLEGATQSSLTGQIGASSTMFNMMSLFNQYQGGGRRNGVVNNVSAFGAMASQNPLGMMGNMLLHGDQLRSNQMQTDGAMAAENQAIAILREQGRNKGPNGYDPNEVAAVMSNFMPADQVRAYMNMRSSQTNPGTVAQSRRAMRAQSMEQIMQTISQEGLYDKPIGRLGTGIKKFGQTIYGDMAESFGYPAAKLGGSIADFVAETWHNTIYSTNKNDYLKERSGGYGLDMKAINKNVNDAGYDWEIGPSDMTYSIASKLDMAARKGGEGSEYARRLLAAGFESPEAKELFAKFLSAQTDPTSKRALESLQDSLKVFNRVAGVANKHVMKLSDEDSQADNAASTIEDQARSLFLEDGPLAVNLDTAVRTGKYKELTGSLGAGGAGRVRELAKAGAVRRGVKDLNGSDASLKQLFAKLVTGNKADAETTRLSSSEVDYASMRESTERFDSAVMRFETAVGQMGGNSGNPSMPGVQQRNSLMKEIGGFFK